MSFNRRWYALSQTVFSDCLFLANQYHQDSQADSNFNGVQTSSIQPPRQPPKSQKAQVNLPKPPKPNQDFRGTKRASGEKAGSNKRRKNGTPDPEGSSGAEKQLPRKNPSKEVSAHLNAIGADSEISASDISEVFDEAPKVKSRKRNLGSAKPSAKAKGATTAISESEMSEVLDEVPKGKGRKRKADSAKPTAKKTETSKIKKPSEQSTDPEAEEIKRLQGWLIKCGIRKMWHRELAPYNTSKAKAVHLKKLLADAGMTGRYSMEKAAQIKEERELQADLEAVQEGAKQWGKVESDGDDANSDRPKRRLARGLQELDFLNDEDGEETD